MHQSVHRNVTLQMLSLVTLGMVREELQRRLAKLESRLNGGERQAHSESARPSDDRSHQYDQAAWRIKVMTGRHHF